MHRLICKFRLPDVSTVTFRAIFTPIRIWRPADSPGRAQNSILPIRPVGQDLHGKHLRALDTGGKKVEDCPLIPQLRAQNKK